MAQHAYRRPRPASLYDVLQVTPRAEPDVIQASYRVLARIYHPDVSRDPESAVRMREINAAYDVLRDPTRRAQYDSERAWAAEARRTKRPSRTALGGTAAFTARSSLSAYASSMGVAPAFRGRLVLFVLSILGFLSLLLWLLLETMNESPVALFPV